MSLPHVRTSAKSGKQVLSIDITQLEELPTYSLDSIASLTERRGNLGVTKIVYMMHVGRVNMQRRASMKSSRIVICLSWLIAVLAFVAAGIGLFYQDGGNSFSFTTLHGQSVQIYGQGLYRYDIPIIAVGYRAADAVTLVLALPLLIISLLLYRRGQFRGGLLLTGVLAYFLYTYGSMAFGAAYNPLFLVYVVPLFRELVCARAFTHLV